LPAAKASAGSQFFALPKKIKKDPVKGLELAVTKVLLPLALHLLWYKDQVVLIIPSRVY
jgi:hypothetical protein